MTTLALLCPGQGGQHRAMFDRLAGHTAAEAVLQTATAVLGYDPRAQALSAGPDALYKNSIAQPLVCSAILATWAAIGSFLPPPRLIAGYSVGELAAYGCAGALDVAQTLTLALQRATLMDAAATPGALTAVIGLDRRQVETLCQEHAAYIAIVNGPDHFVVGASLPQLAAIETAAQDRGATRVVRLRVGVAAHTPLLQSASRLFEAALAASAMRDPTVPVLAGISGAPVRTRETAIATLATQLSSTVDWLACMHAAYEMGARVFLELGPGKALTRMLSDTHPNVAARSVDEFRSLDGVHDWVQQHLA
jgi:[acyl-carrier-protein] S-malonyltransferase